MGTCVVLPKITFVGPRIYWKKKTPNFCSRRSELSV